MEATTKATRSSSNSCRTVQAAAQEMDATLKERANLPGHAAKVAHITAYFKDPAKLRAFVTTYQPGQWKAAVLMMYFDTFVPPAAPTPVPTPQPLRRATWPPGRVLPNGRPVTALEAATSAWIGLACRRGAITFWRRHLTRAILPPAVVEDLKSLYPGLRPGAFPTATRLEYRLYVGVATHSPSGA